MYLLDKINKKLFILAHYNIFKLAGIFGIFLTFEQLIQYCVESIYIGDTSANNFDIFVLLTIFIYFVFAASEMAEKINITFHKGE